MQVSPNNQASTKPGQLQLYIVPVTGVIRFEVNVQPLLRPDLLMTRRVLGSWVALRYRHCLGFVEGPYVIVWY